MNVQRKMAKPKRPKQHITGDVAQTSVALTFKKWGWTADILQSDYGEDLEVNIFADGQRTNLYFRCQVKGRGRGDEVIEADNGHLSVAIDTSICRQWLEEYFPIFIVVHDAKQDRAYWSNPLPHIRSDYSRLEQQTISFQVSREMELASSRQRLSEEVAAFYAKLLRLEHFSLTCDVYPLLMPGYRGEPASTSFVDFEESEGENPELARRQTNINLLPSWMTVLKTLQPRFVSGLTFTTSDHALEGFIQLLKQALAKSSFKMIAGEWLSFIVGPIRLLSRDEHPEQQTALSSELTRWQCLSNVGGAIVDDRQHAFAPPRDFLREVRRRSLSWDRHFYVCPELDLAVQLFAHVAPTPDDQLRAEQFKRHIQSQMLPWRCRLADEEAVRRAVGAHEYAFVITPEAETEPGWVSGVITMPGTNPELGMFHLVMDWREFDQRPIAASLQHSGTLQTMPGEEAGPEVWAIVDGLFGHIYAPPPAELLVALPDHVRGIPINHSRRLIEFLRLRKRSKVDTSLIDKEAVKRTLNDRLGTVARVSDICGETFEASEAINRYAMFVEPSFEISSGECITLIQAEMAAAFDTLEERRCGADCSTRDILSTMDRSNSKQP